MGAEHRGVNGLGSFPDFFFPQSLNFCLPMLILFVFQKTILFSPPCLQPYKQVSGVHNWEMTLHSRYKHSSKGVTTNHLTQKWLAVSATRSCWECSFNRDKVFFFFFLRMIKNSNDDQNKFYHNSHKMWLIFHSFQENKTLYVHYWENKMAIPTVCLNSPQLNSMNQPCFLPYPCICQHHNRLKRAQAAVSLLLITRAQCW